MSDRLSLLAKVVHGVRTWLRLTTIGILAALGVPAAAGPAAAHVEVSADKTRAGATNVTLTFHGEAENPSGIKSERVVLPEGIAPADVTAVKLPSGWAFTANSDGFVVGGKALPSGQDAEWKVKVKKLPDGETRLSFKTLETYADGEISRWIEIQEKGEDEPSHPAPLVTLKPGPSVAATSPAPASSAVLASAVPSPSGAALPPAALPVADADEGFGGWWVWVLVGLVVVAAGVGLLLRRRGAE